MQVISNSYRLALVLIVAAGSTACSSGGHYRVSAAEFQKLARRESGTIFHSEFIGATSSRAFLSVWEGLPSSLGGGDHVYSVELRSLPAEIVQRIRAGGNPWSR